MKTVAPRKNLTERCLYAERTSVKRFREHHFGALFPMKRQHGCNQGGTAVIYRP